MRNYRLKKEALPFFNHNLATTIADLEFWKKHQVDEKALEEVLPAHIIYGHYSAKKEVDGYDSSSLGGWEPKKGKEFYFTIRFPSVKFNEMDTFSNGRITRDLMQRIQHQIDSFYRDFNENQIER